jgi:hypothetical protein
MISTYLNAPLSPIGSFTNSLFYFCHRARVLVCTAYSFLIIQMSRYLRCLYSLFLIREDEDEDDKRITWYITCFAFLLLLWLSLFLQPGQVEVFVVDAENIQILALQCVYDLYFCWIKYLLITQEFFSMLFLTFLSNSLPLASCRNTYAGQPRRGPEYNASIIIQSRAQLGGSQPPFGFPWSNSGLFGHVIVRLGQVLRTLVILFLVFDEGLMNLWVGMELWSPWSIIRALKDVCSLELGDSSRCPCDDSLIDVCSEISANECATLRFIKFHCFLICSDIKLSSLSHPLYYIFFTRVSICGNASTA